MDRRPDALADGISNLAATMDMPAFARGMGKAIETLSMPFRSMDFKLIRGYVYMSPQPYSTDPAELGRRMETMRTRMMEHVPGLLQRWRGVYEPEVRSINDDTLKGDYRSLSDRDLSQLLDTLVEKREREGELHFLAVFPAGAAAMMFEEVYTQLIGPPTAGEHFQLLQGFANKSVEVGDGLWRLAQEARKRPAVLAVIRNTAPSATHRALAERAEGKAFHDAVEEFLDVYGWRGSEMDIASPTWKEDPTMVYKLIREYVARDDYDPEAEFRSLVAARQAREKLAFETIGAGEAQGMFRQVLAAAQQYLPIQEDHNFWIDQQGVAVQRVPVLEAGRRFADAGRIADAAEVFLLKFDELQDALRDGNSSLRELVEQRRREREEYRNVPPPPALGAAPPPQVADNPMFGKFFGAPPEEHPDPRMINGNAASAGKVTGTARVILTLDEGERLRQGEILVCPSTMPPWTPLFALASGVVTDHGGVLSHTAIVAREYRIPAVVGTKVGTSLIKDGQTITVDGAGGTVKLEAG